MVCVLDRDGTTDLRAIVGRRSKFEDSAKARSSHDLDAMLAAALIPMIFILALLVMFAFGAWDLGIFTGVVTSALLVFIAAALVRVAYEATSPKHAK